MIKPFVFSRAQLQAVFKDFNLVKEFERLIDLLNNYERVGYLDFTESSVFDYAERRLAWNSTDGSLNTGLYNNIVLKNGQDLFIYAQSDEAAVIPTGSGVMITGVTATGKLKIKLAVADGSIDSNYILGVAAHDITPTNFGYVALFASVLDFDTTGGNKTVPEVWANNDLLYFDAVYPGELTNVMPTAPAIKLPVAIVTDAAVDGSINVFVKHATSVNKLNDVSASTPHDLDLLQYNTALGRWEASTDVWQDIDFPIIIRTTGPGIPTLDVLNNNLTMPQWAVNAYNVCEAQELVHGWKEGSEVFWHIHLTTNGTNVTDRYVKFELEYGYVDVNDVWIFPAPITTADLLIPANTITKTMLVMNLGSFTPSIHIAGHVVARLKRVASTGAAPTKDPWISMLQLHVQIDTLGSRSIMSK